MERFKTGIRPAIAVWCICMLTLHYSPLGWIRLDGIGLGLIIAGIVQWIPDRALKRVKEAWSK